jgi:hypothetical protein
LAHLGVPLVKLAFVAALAIACALLSAASAHADCTNCNGICCGGNCYGACNPGQVSRCCSDGTPLCGNIAVECCTDSDCGTGQKCLIRPDLSYRCVCPDFGQPCNGTCVDTRSDPNNCGACGQTCQGGKICQNSQCVCPPGKTDCEGKCVDLSNDPQYCGDCFRPCNLNDEKCENSHCVCTDTGVICGTHDVCATCDETAISCKGTVCCDDLHPINCGALGCVDTSSDMNHCGACNSKCPSGVGVVCCVGNCMGPRQFRSDPENCGSCANACADDQVCRRGKCTRVSCRGGCRPGFTCIRGHCVSAQ